MKIIVAEYLKYLNRSVEEYNQFKLIKNKLIIEKLTCKKLAELVGVTPATLTNLNTDSKFSLLRSVSYEIYDWYMAYFDAMTKESMKNPCDDGSFTVWNSMYVLETLVDSFNERMV